jgi:hypothetical protein
MIIEFEKWMTVWMASSTWKEFKFGAGVVISVHRTLTASAILFHHNKLHRP